MSFAEIERDFIRSHILPSFEWAVCSTPSRVNPLQKPLPRCRVALVGTAGAHLASDPAFDMMNPLGDPSYRVIPRDAPLDALRLSHFGYNTRRVERDKNCVFPLERLRELAQDGAIGSVSPRHFSFMGYIPVPAPLVEETAPQVAGLLEQDRVDLALLVPA